MNNLIRRQIHSGDADNSTWQAIRISGLSSGGGVGRYFAGFSDLALGLRIHTINSFATALLRGIEDAGVTANSLHGFGGTAVAEVSVTGSCRFSDNHCSAGARRIPIAVDLTAASIIASSNRVECVRDTHGLDLKVASQTAFTVLGNITGGPIFVNGALLSGVWQPLNIAV